LLAAIESMRRVSIRRKRQKTPWRNTQAPVGSQRMASARVLLGDFSRGDAELAETTTTRRRPWRRWSV